MLIDSIALNHYKLDSLEGVIGSICGLYFDDQSWSIRYLILDTGYWLPERQVLISPHALMSDASQKERHFSVELTKKQVEDSPALNCGQPPSRNFEIAYQSYYKWPEYWNGAPSRPGQSPAPPIRCSSMPAYANSKYAATHGESDPHLRNTRDIVGHHIQAEDGELGHVESFIIDTQAWNIRDVVIKTGFWWAGQCRLLSPEDIDQLGWDESKVFVYLSREGIKHAPEYEASSLAPLHA